MNRTSRFLLGLLVLAVCFQVGYAEYLGPGKYYGVVVFDRWDGCFLYRGVYLTYISENAKEKIREYAGQLAEINATDVFQPINPGDGRIREFEYLGVPPETKDRFNLSGLEVRSFGGFKDGERPTLVMEILNVGAQDRELLTGELAPTLLTKQPAVPRRLSPSDGPSVALLTRVSIERVSRYGDKGSGVAQAMPYRWSTRKEDALPDRFVLKPGEKKRIRITFDLQQGQYEFLCGYGGKQYGRKCIASNIVAFDVDKDGKAYVVEDYSDDVAASGKGFEVSVMSFNIRYGTANDGANHWKNRRGMVFDVIAKYGPDVIGIQEALLFQIDEIRRQLPKYKLIGVGRDDGKTKGEYSGILFRNDKFKIDQSGTFWLSDTPEIPGSITWGNACTRICTWVRFVEKATGRAFYQYNVHLDHISQPSREKSMVLLTRRIRDRKKPDRFVVTGDFNAGEKNPAILFLKAKTTLAAKDNAKFSNPAPMVDTFRVLHPDATNVGTFNGFKGTTTGAKIDYILTTSDVKVLNAQILHDNVEGRYPSDHFPVTARLRFSTRTTP